MKKLLCSLFVALIAFVSCNKIEKNKEERPISSEPFSIQAYADDIDTKATIDDNLIIKWAENDLICVAMYEEGEYTPWEREFKLTGGAGTTNGTFTLQGSGTPGDNTRFNAIYPKYSNTFSDGSAIDNTIARIKLLESYTWSENTILAPMVAYGTDTDKKGLHFKHVGGAVKVKLKDLPKGTTKVSLTSNKDIIGDFTYTVANIAASNPDGITTPSNGGNTVSFTFGALESTADRVFYFPTPVVTDPTFTIKVYVGDMLVWQAKTPNTQPSITRGGLLVMEDLTVTPYYLYVKDYDLAASSSNKWGTSRSIYISSDQASMGTETIGGIEYNKFIIPRDKVGSSTDVYYKGENGCEVKLTFTPTKGAKQYLYKTNGFEIIPTSSTFNSEKRIWACVNGCTDLRMYVWGSATFNTTSWSWDDTVNGFKKMTLSTAKYDYSNWSYFKIPDDESSCNLIFVWKVGDTLTKTNDITNVSLENSVYYKAWGDGNSIITWN